MYIHTHTHVHSYVYVGILFNTFALSLYFCYILFGASYFMLCSHSSVSDCREFPTWKTRTVFAAASHRRRRLNYNKNPKWKHSKFLRSMAQSFYPALKT